MDAFVSGLSNNYNHERTRRFASYAVSCIKEHLEFDGEYMRKNGMDERVIEEYRSAFGCIEEAFKIWNG